MIIIQELKVLELFGGIGAIRKALIKQKIPHKIVDYVEVDKNCVKSYNALYNESFEAKNIIDYHPTSESVDLVIHGSPCQDFSLAGLKAGGLENSGTRSSLLFETVRIIKEMKEKPKWIIWENTKGVLSSQMRNALFQYLDYLCQLGYRSNYQVLNSLDFGIPQKRERIFVVSCLEKNVFNFCNLKKDFLINIKSILEDNPDEKYLVTQNSILKQINQNDPKVRLIKPSIDQYFNTITTKQVRIPNAGIIDLGDKNYRYLTERECFRLMGFDDHDFDKLREVYKEKENKTSSILYKQASNSIVVNVLEAILREIIRGHL